MAAERKGRYQVLVGAAGTLAKDGRVLYHHLGDLVDLADAEAERLLGLGAVADTRQPGQQAPDAPQAAPSQPEQPQASPPAGSADQGGQAK